jgi:hypothetical protein
MVGEENMNWLRTSAFLKIGFALFSTMAWGQPRLDLTEGALFVDGSFAFQYDMIGFADF